MMLHMKRAIEKKAVIFRIVPSHLWLGPRKCANGVHRFPPTEGSHLSRVVPDIAYEKLIPEVPRRLGVVAESRLHDVGDVCVAVAGSDPARPFSKNHGRTCLIAKRPARQLAMVALSRDLEA